jgi:hypothetical protein
MASSGARCERSVAIVRGVYAGSVVLRVRGGRGSVIVADVGGAWLGTIVCWTSSCRLGDVNYQP